MGEQVTPLQLCCHGKGCATGQRIAPEGAGMVTRLKHVTMMLHGQSANGEAAPQALGHGHGVRLNAQMLMAPELTGATHPHLNLVQDEQNPPLVTELAQGSKDAGISRLDPTFPLERLQQHCCHGWPLGVQAINALLDGREIIVIHIVETLHQGSEALVVLGLPRCAQAGHGGGHESWPGP